MPRRKAAEGKNKPPPQHGQPRWTGPAALAAAAPDPKTEMFAALQLEHDGRPRPPARNRRDRVRLWALGAALVLLAMAFALPWLPLAPSDATPIDPDEKDAFSRAVRGASPAAWREFLERYPQGQFEQEAQRFYELARERSDFQAARSEDRIGGWSRFLELHPASTYRTYVEQRLEQLRAERARQPAPDPFRSAALAYSAASQANTEAAWRDFLAQHRDNAYSFAAYNNLGALLYGESDFAAAHDAFASAARLAPDNPRVQYNLGNTLLALGRIEQAQEAYQAALALDPAYAAAQEALEQASATRFTGRLMWDGEPVAGAEVEVLPDGAVRGRPALAARSDANGRFRLPELAPGEYTVRARMQRGELVLSGAQSLVVRGQWTPLLMELQQRIEPAPATEPQAGEPATVLAWSPVEGADHYIIDLYDFGFIGGPSQVQSVFQQQVEDPQLRLRRELAPGHEYRWRVRAYRGSNLIGISGSILLRTRRAGEPVAAPGRAGADG